MKKTFVIISILTMTALAMCPGSLNAADIPATLPDATADSPYQPGLEFGGGAVFSTEDFDKENVEMGVTASLDYFFSRNFGVFAEGMTFDKNQKEIDRVGGGIDIRAPLGDIEFLGFLGGMANPLAIGTDWGYGYMTETRFHRGFGGLYLEARFGHVSLRAGGRLDVDLEEFGQENRFMFPVSLNINF